MAVKNHALDDKIIQAATAEFLEHGYQKASLRKIAERAGISTGALYTRYENKDKLFSSLVKNLLDDVAEEFRPLTDLYMEARESGNVEKFLEAVQKEEEISLDILFRHYEQCILFFCCSDGSSIQAVTEQFMSKKAKDTVEYFRSMAKRDIDLEGIELIMSEQFYYYRKILQEGLSRERAISAMKTVEIFMEAGWKDFFQRIM